MLHRRDFHKTSAAAAAAARAPGFPAMATTATARARDHVVIVGGGYGGATTAKYLRMWSNGTVDVTLIERNPTFVVPDLEPRRSAASSRWKTSPSATTT